MNRGGILEEFKYAFRKQDNSLMQIILLNVAVFVFLNTLGVILWFAGLTEFRPSQCMAGSDVLFCQILQFIQLPSDPFTFITHPWTLITYFFLHVSFFHILFNMLFLYWFGRLIKEFLGDKRVVSLYVLGGLAGGLLYILLYNLLPQFKEVVSDAYMLGASAGVYAVVVGAAVFMPNYTLYLLLFGQVRIKYIAVVFILLSFFLIPQGNAGGNIAHLGGAAIGYFYIRQLQKGNDHGTWIFSVITMVKSFFVRQPKIKVTYSSGKAKSTNESVKNKRAKSPSAPDQAEIDAILDKISQSGYESLSKAEKQKLFNASKK